MTPSDDSRRPSAGGDPTVPIDAARTASIQTTVADELCCPEQEPAMVAAAASPSSLPTGSISRQVLALALPMMGEQFFNFLVGFVDTLLAGTISKEATVAVGAGAYMGWFVTLVGSLVGTGAAALVSRSIGARDLATANRAASQSLTLALSFGVVVSMIVYWLAPLLSGLLVQTDEARHLLDRFLRIDALGYTLYSVVLVCGGVMRSAGDTRTPMKIMIAVNIVNTVLATGAVKGWFGQPMGMEGIAYSTVIARSIGGLLLIAQLFHGLRELKVSLPGMRPDWAIISRMMRVGVPAAMDAGLMWMAQLGFIFVIGQSGAGEAGTINSAAHMIAVRVEAVSYLPAIAWMTAAGTLVGQYLGAGRPDLATKAGYTAARQGALVTSSIGLIFFFFSHQIYALMSQDQQVREIGGSLFRFIAFAQPVTGAMIVFIGALRGAGDTRTTLLFSLVGGLCIRVPVAALGVFVFGGGLLGAWSGMWCDNLTKFGMAYARFRGGKWKNVKV